MTTTETHATAADIANIAQLLHADLSHSLAKIDMGDAISFTEYLRKEQVLPEDPTKPSSSSTGIRLGMQPQPFNFSAAREFQATNIYQSTCIVTKKNATMGMGFWTPSREKMLQERQMGIFSTDEEQSRVDEVLNAICIDTFQSVFGKVVEDFYNVGNGYLEVVRRNGPDKPPTGLHHLPSHQPVVYVEDVDYNYHYNILSNVSDGSGVPRKFARFGDLKAFAKRMQLTPEQTITTSEVIHFKQDSAWNRWYGIPEWLACTSAIELAQALQQHKYDFFMNRGVPEFMLFLLGKKLPPEDWKVVLNALKAQIGVGNQHKSFAINVDDPEMKVQLEKLGMSESKGDDYEILRSTLAQDIVSAHRVPTTLAGIHISGARVSSNELPNAIMSFQVLCIGPAQTSLRQMLAATLGAKETGLDLSYADFRFNKMTEELDLAMMNTVAQMKQTLPEAKASGRDLSQGLKS